MMRNKKLTFVAGFVGALGLFVLMSVCVGRCSVDVEAWPLPQGGHASQAKLNSEAVSRDVVRENAVSGNPADTPPALAGSSTLTVRCRSRSGHHPISGIIIHLVNDVVMATVGNGATDASGSVHFDSVLPGSYLAVANDGAQEWVQTSVAPDRGRIVVGDRASAMVIEFTFDVAAVMWVKFIGDEVCLAFPRGPTPGLRMLGNKVPNPEVAGDPESVDIWGHDGRLKPAPSSPGSDEYCFVYAPDEAIGGGGVLPLQSMTVYTARHGVKRYSVPLVWAREAKAPVVVDCSDGHEVEGATLRMRVTGMHGGMANVGCVTLSARSAKGEQQRQNWMLQFMPHGECLVPSGIEYDISVGDFPVVWQCGARRWSARSGVVEEVDLSLDWPTARITEARLTRNGEPIVRGVMSCSVGGDFKPFCRGAMNYPIKAGRMPVGDYPVGDLRFVFRQGDLHWNVNASVVLGQDKLILDLQGAGSDGTPR